MQKISPLLDWSLSDVWAYLKQFDVPYNALHDKGYTSIGCAPCTRAITPGEDVRAGRWWWENPEIKECGLHPDKRHKTVVVSRCDDEPGFPGQTQDVEKKERGPGSDKAHAS